MVSSELVQSNEITSIQCKDGFLLLSCKREYVFVTNLFVCVACQLHCLPIVSQRSQVLRCSKRKLFISVESCHLKLRYSRLLSVRFL